MKGNLESIRIHLCSRMSYVTLLIACCGFWNCQNLNVHQSSTSDLENTSFRKQRGVHVFGRMDSLNLQPILKNKYEWVTLVPYGGQKDFDTSKISYFRGDSTQLQRKDSIWSSQIDVAHDTGFKVFLKPHIWLNENSDGKWRSDIFPPTDEDWESWKKNYRDFILFYAKIAEKNNVEFYCIGTELSRLSVEKAQFWIELIEDVRTIYSGQITYAANWYNEYEKISFWNKLDFIGVQAYFPLSSKEFPSTADLSKAWGKYNKELKSISDQYNRKVIFTELGYKSTSDAAIEPWEWLSYSGESRKTKSDETQANCYEAFFDSVWPQDWFAGVHVWQIRCDSRRSVRDKGNIDFTPKGKAAESVISSGFSATVKS